MRGTIIFFFNDTATTEIYTLALHDALPISRRRRRARGGGHEDVHEPTGRARVARRARGRARRRRRRRDPGDCRRDGDRKSTRLNSSHANISYAVFCLKKKNTSHLLSATLSC